MESIIRATFIMFSILAILIGCASSEEATRTDQHDFYNEGIAFSKTGEYDRAIACFSKAIKLEPRFADAYIERGITSGYKSQHCKAISDFTKAIEISPKYALAYGLKGSCL
jgi:tetratricopeptide (TPR) repeat protein